MTGETGHSLRGDYSRMRPDYTVDQDWDAYSEAQHVLWRRLYQRQAGLVEKYACREFRETLASLGMPAEIVMRHRTPQFGHIFSSDNYSAGYYSYLWSDTLSADAWEAFLEKSGAYDKEVAARLRDNVFSTGNTRDPAEAYRAFRGRDAGIGALMRKRGFPAPEEPARPAQSRP